MYNVEPSVSITPGAVARVLTIDRTAESDRKMWYDGFGYCAASARRRLTPSAR